MAVDASIYGQVQQPQATNPLNSLAQALQIKAYQGSLDKSDREAAQQNRLLQLVQSPEFTSAAPQQRAQLLESQGLFDQAGKVITNAAAANKDQRAADVSSFDLQAKKLDMLSNLAGTVTDQPSYDRARAIAQQQGLDVSQWNPQYDPAGVAQFAQATLSAKERLNAKIQQQGQQIQMRGQDLTQSTAIRGQDLSRDTALQGQEVTRRGQDLTNVRAREANENGRIPSGYRRSIDGSLEFIPGGPADPSAAKKAAPTEFQGKSAIFGSRAQEADRILSELGTDFSPAAINTKNAVSDYPIVGGAIEAGVNATMSKESQKAEQAQRDFVNAVLRLESGAAIGKDEFANAKRQYFPQPGDSDEVIAQKAANRKLQIQGLLGNAGNAPIPKAQAAESGSSKKTKVINGKTYENDGKGWYVVN